MAAKKKSSLVANINKRKKAGKSRPKSRSTVTPAAYAKMEEGWPTSGSTTKKRPGAKKKSRAKTKTGAKKKAGAKTKTGAKKKRATTK